MRILNRLFINKEMAIEHYHKYFKNTGTVKNKNIHL